MSTEAAAAGAVALCVAGMMLVIAGVITTGLFLPGVFIIGLGLFAFAATGVLSIARADGPDSDGAQP